MSTASRDYIGSYRLLRVIGPSRTCTIWEAMNDAEQKRFAIKILQREFAKDRAQITALKQEFAVGSSVTHKYLLHVYEFSQHDGRPFLVTEFFPGQNLKNEIRDGVERLAWRAPQIIERAAEGLHHLHEHKWVHRDIKPDNFIIAPGGGLKLIDFAIALREARGGLSKWLPFGRSKTVQGTRSYMSPEQIRGEAVDRRADVYSFGCTVYELLTGKPPYTGVNADDLLTKHLRAGVPSIVAGNNNVTREFADLTASMLAKKPTDRPESMQAFLEQFRQLRVFRKAPEPPPQNEHQGDGGR